MQRAPASGAGTTVIRSDPAHPVTDPFDGKFGAHDYRSLVAGPGIAVFETARVQHGGRDHRPGGDRAGRECHSAGLRPLGPALRRGARWHGLESLHSRHGATTSKLSGRRARAAAGETGRDGKTPDGPDGDCQSISPGAPLARWSSLRNSIPCSRSILRPACRSSRATASEPGRSESGTRPTGFAHCAAGGTVRRLMIALRPTLRAGPPGTGRPRKRSGCRRCALVGRRPPDRRPAGRVAADAAHAGGRSRHSGRPEPRRRVGVGRQYPPVPARRGQAPLRQHPARRHALRARAPLPRRAVHHRRDRAGAAPAGRSGRISARSGRRRCDS